MIGLALMLTLLAPQDTPVAWEKIGEVEGGGAAIEVSAVRATGDFRNLNVRVSSPNTNRVVIALVFVNCATRTSRVDSGFSIYVDGKFVETKTPPPEVMQERPVSGDPLAGPVAAYVCK